MMMTEVTKYGTYNAVKLTAHELNPQMWKVPPVVISHSHTRLA